MIVLYVAILKNGSNIHAHDIAAMSLSSCRSKTSHCKLSALTIRLPAPTGSFHASQVAALPCRWLPCPTGGFYYLHLYRFIICSFVGLLSAYIGFVSCMPLRQLPVPHRWLPCLDYFI